MTLRFGKPSIRDAAAAVLAGNWRVLSPQAFYALAGRLTPWFVSIAGLLCSAAIYLEFFADAGVDAARPVHIVFIHEPAAWMSLAILTVMAFWGVIWLRFRFRLSRLLLFALAPTGAMFAFLALWTGALWGKPTWGTWWLWDPRLTAELLLLLLYAGIMALHAVAFDAKPADDVASLIALFGIIAVPVVYCTMYLADATPDRAFVGLTGAPALESSALLAAVLMTLSFWMYSFATSLSRVRSIILERERDAEWAVKDEGRGR